MSKTWLVLKNEFLTTIRRKSFIIGLLILPLISGIMVLVLNRYGDKATDIAAQVFAPPTGDVIEGYVDHSGLITALPPDRVPAGRLTAFATEDEAKAALSSGEITGYYVVPADLIQNGKVTYFRSDFNPFGGMDQSNIFNYVLNYNLVGQDLWRADRVGSPYVLSKESISTQPVRDSDNPLSFFLPYAVTMLFYIMILTSASYMLNSVTLEKQNRVLEILMSSIKPSEMLVGKITALALVGLVQTLVWAGTGLVFLRLSGTALNIPPAFQLPLSFLFWSVIYFLLGYFLYATLLAGVGALVKNLQEASQATTVAIIPLVIPIIFLSALVDAPNSGLAVTLSLIPFTAPVTMMTRISAVSVPAWQIAASIALLLLTIFLAMRAVSGMFRAQTLLSGQAFSLKRFASAFAGRS